MNVKVRRQRRTRKQRITRRLGRAKRIGTDRPELSAANIWHEIAERTRAITTGGIGAVHMLVKRLGLDRAINERLGLLKVLKPRSAREQVVGDCQNVV